MDLIKASVGIPDVLEHSATEHGVERIGLVRKLDRIGTQERVDVRIALKRVEPIFLETWAIVERADV